MNSKFKNLQDSFYRMNESISELKKELDSKTIQKKEKPLEQVVKPIEETKPIEPVVVETPKVEQITVEKPIEVVESISAPKYKPVPKPVYIPKKSWFETFKENNPDLEKFVGENLINKIGILILVLGISFFVKYAIDKDWINEPARVGIGVLAGSLVMAIAHKLKKNFAAFSSVLVAGAISIFYFTIAIAFHEYQLFSQTVAFAIMIVITAFSVLVSISYNRQELAVLSYIGGFAVPFMISTGSGNYVVLFSYIAILNIGLLAISYFKKWKVITILSFILTSILFSTWYTTELYDNKLPHLGALLFATLFYFIFSIVIVLNNLRNKGVFSVIEYMILVANTFLFFGLGLGIIHNWGINFKGMFTLLLALYNLVYAIILYRKFGLDKNAIYLLIGLVLTFVTLTIPIQFEGNQITMFWAAEAVLLFWLSQKSKINSFKIGAIIVQFLTIISLMLDWQTYTYNQNDLSVILNSIFITGIVVVVSLVLSYFILKKEETTSKIFNFTFDAVFYKNALLVVTVIVLYFTGIFETIYQSNQLLSNSSSAQSFSVTYHFVFTAILLFLVSKYKNIIFRNVLLIITLVSTLLYIVWFYSLPNKEIITNIIQDSNVNYAFYLHYIIFACLVYFGFEVYKISTTEPKLKILNSKIAPWLFVFAIVYILSNEIMTHSLQFSQDNIDKVEFAKAFPKTDSSDHYVVYEKEYYLDLKLDNFKRQIIKIGYPILWGIFSFVFLIIGIKQQWKNLRIIALSLLGLTIVKLFAYDINNVSETGKIIAFILLGVLILIISFVYQKIKKLVVDETSKKNSDEN
ncbi:DUF2339 domain-containing protein [Flavobacterium gelidilacus]|uniref:DUF2339 domain-containing protein n=1 Tax=Flavobacterium gelidilacus TaxID=206041 RepID=UPI00040619E7|nr:DUF2339 domain-containing protein [Flavobacterium gelidilacus]